MDLFLQAQDPPRVCAEHHVEVQKKGCAAAYRGMIRTAGFLIKKQPLYLVHPISKTTYFKQDWWCGALPSRWTHGELAKGADGVR
jgi:hypothetical protein